MLHIPEKVLLQIFDISAPCMLIKADPPNFSIVMASDAYLGLTGFKRDELIGKAAFTVFPDRPDAPTGAITTKKAILEAIATKRKVEIPEYAYHIVNPITHVMEEYWWASTFDPIPDNDGAVVYILGTATDLTGKVKSRQLLDESYREQWVLNEKLSASNEELAATNEELVTTNEDLVQVNRQLAGTQANLHNQQKRLQSFFMEAPAGICILDGPDLVFELINPLYQQLFPGRDLLGKPLLEAVPEVKDTPTWDILQEVLRSGKTFEGNELLIPIAGTAGGPIERRYFNFIYQARREPGGTITGIMVFVIEVTDAVITKIQIQENAERFKTQMNAMPQIAWTNSPSGDVEFYNLQWHDYTGLTFEDTKDRGWEKVIHPDDLAYNLDRFREILESKTGGEFEVREKRRDGAYRWHLVRMRPIKNEAGEVIQWAGTATDIQELKQLQEQKDDFISIASHELKTPVTSLKASLQLMDRLRNDPSATTFPKLIEHANRSVVKISELINDLLDASRLQANQLNIVKQQFTVSEMLNGCCHHVRAAGGHELIFEGDKELTVVADEHRIDQVVVNFVNNAVKYAPDSKNIYLIAEKIGSDIKISVKDNGPGIEPAKIEHLFSKYYRAEYSGSQFAGLGLGLYISAEIVKRHGGQIGVDSELGKGSTFWFTLPA